MLKLQFKDRRRESVWLVDTKFSIGKSSSNSLMIEDPSIDDTHAEIVNNRDQLSLIKKTNKGIVKINGEVMLQNSAIKANDTITLGTVELELIDSQSVMSNKSQQKKPVHIWSLHSSASWLEKNDFIINKKTIIGRDPSCDISLTLDYLSRNHVSLEPKNAKLFIEDLNSSNGTYLNGKRIEKAELKPGDKIKLDVLTFEVRGPSGKSASDPNQTIIRTSAATSTKVNNPAKPKPAKLKSPSKSPQPVNSIKSQTRKKRLASEGKQPWISGDNQLKTKKERKKGRGGVIFIVISLIIVSAGLAFILIQ
jgi:pSer/pThr/pTyr-binding forkhead associated (FHA) protein